MIRYLPSIVPSHVQIMGKSVPIITFLIHAEVISESFKSQTTRPILVGHVNIVG
jgi:hypothetical protein